MVDAAYMWSRHRHLFPFAAGAFIAVVIVADWAGTEDWPTRIVLGAAGVAVAVAATTEYKILAQTTSGFVLMQASRVRQVATALVKELPNDVNVRQVGGTILAADWEVDEVVYTVPRSSEQAISRMAGAG